LLAAVKNAICGTPLGLVIDGSVACKPLSGQSVTLFLILGQRKQDDSWVKLDETLRSHSPSIEWASAKTTGGATIAAIVNAFTGAHPLRSLTSAARAVLAALRHIRSSARNSWHAPRTTLAAVQKNGRFMPGFTAPSYQK
jgi:hypothetical protein